MLFVMPTTAFAKESYDIDSVLNDTALYLYKAVSNPQVGQIGGEWAILGLARSGIDIPDEYYLNYCKNVEEYVKKCDGKLHNKKYTEYSRVIIALTAIGKDPSDVAGYNLLTPLGDYEKTVWQGINGAIFALIALDCGNYDMHQNASAKVQATREMYVNHILEKQTPDGGWALSGDVADADVTAMALQALSKYRDNEKVGAAIQKALSLLSEMQNEKGGFSSFGSQNSESCVQTLVALCELGISIDDERFIKNGNTIFDSLMSYYSVGCGFAHDKESDSSNLLATEQAFYGLVALKRANDGKNALYQMSDAISIGNVDVVGLKNKHSDVRKLDIINPDKTFSDIKNHKEKQAIEALALRGIINGKSEKKFDPDSTMTRAEFATIVARGLGLTQKETAVFKDVTSKDWFFGYVGTAYHYGIIKGVSQNKFNPNGTITREEAAVMVARAAKLCGHDTTLSDTEVRNILAGFADYKKASDWSKESIAFCCKTKILDDSVMNIQPKEAVTRGEIAGILYNLLSNSNLL